MDIESALPRHMREFVTDMFGPFDPRLDFRGVEYVENRTPFTYYPPPYSQFRIGICLPLAADEDWKISKYLVHEMVHCLTPNGLPSSRATVLEEGPAEHCSTYFLRAHFRIEGAHVDWADTVTGAYRDAFDLIERVVRHEGSDGMSAGVRAMRKSTGAPFAEISADTLRQYFPNTPASIVDHLSERFSERSWGGHPKV
jgi:hypothetical protein